MTDRTGSLRELAHRNFAEFANDRGLVAAIVTGSVARGGCDAASDIDTILYFDGPLSAERLEAEKTKGEASGGGFYGGTPEEGFGAWRRIDGVKCDFGFEPASEVDCLIDDLYERTDLDLDKQLIVLGIRDAIVLAGEERVAGWRERTDVYPRALGRAMLEKHLKPAPAWVYRVMAAERGERVWLTELMVEVASNLLGVLCGLNEVWHPGKLKGSRRASAGWATGIEKRRDSRSTAWYARKRSKLPSSSAAIT